VIREEDRVVEQCEGNEESRVRRLRDLYVRERTLYLILSVILSQERDFRIGVI